MRFLCDIGPRIAGPEGDKKASRYCEEHFKELGLDLETESLDLAVFKGRDAKLRVLRPELCGLTCIPLTRSCSTSKTGVTAELIFVNSGVEQDYQSKESIVFITFSGEEGGCIGANSYIEKHKNELESIRALVKEVPP